ncbi:MAG TPA: DNA polymerase IV [Gammaproteobacteria bacterium]|nr:DNA polymerase IV [Gammaproteobacteria bacterium]
MIIHADMDAFFASVEIREQPALRGKPVVVGGRAENRGVVAAASYAARQYGIRSAMPTATALKRCPELVVLPGRMALYSEVSRQIQAIFARYTPLIEPLSLDEAFLDVSASTTLFGPAPQIARDIKQAVLDELRLVVSMGVAPNKFVAKIASDLQKPNGFVVVEAADVQTFLDPLPVSRLWGVGKVTEKKLHARQIHSIADLRRASAPFICQHFGQYGEQLQQLARGHDPRAVITERDAKSISHETTFAQDVSDTEILRSVLSNLTEQVAWRMRRQNVRGRTVHLKLRFDDFHTITRARSLSSRTHRTRDLWHTVRQLLNREIANGLPPIRLIGMGVGGFDAEESHEQLDLFDVRHDSDANPGPARSEAGSIDKITDDINRRFGNKRLSRARGLRHPRPGSD